MPNNYVLLDRIELNGTAASVTFDNIPQTGYTDLQVVVSARTNRPASYEDSIKLTFNAITSNYSSRFIRGSGTGATSGVGETTTAIWPIQMPAADVTASTFGSASIYIPNYAGSTFKSVSIDVVQEDNRATAFMNLSAGLSSNTAAITSMTFTPNVGTAIVSGSTFSLYGLAQVGTTPAIAPKADGGNVIGTDGTYWDHAFLSNGTFTPQVALSADVLVIGGGGGAGEVNGAAGGAGGIFYATSQSLAISNYTCSVGGGGAGTNSGDGSNGGNSSFGALTVGVGGGGGNGQNDPDGAGRTGGSGGASGKTNITGTVAGAASTQTGTGGTGYGNAGGSTTGPGTAANGTGGGGGAGAAGGAGSTLGTGAGGVGLATWSSWGAATGTGQNVSGTYYYAGGGGGTYDYRFFTTTAGAGGLGGGSAGAGGNGNSGPSNATANTGGGGGAYGFNGSSSSIPGASGGSGIVIIRYLAA